MVEGVAGCQWVMLVAQGREGHSWQSHGVDGCQACECGVHKQHEAGGSMVAGEPPPSDVSIGGCQPHGHQALRRAAGVPPTWPTHKLKSAGGQCTGGSSASACGGIRTLPRHSREKCHLAGPPLPPPSPCPSPSGASPPLPPETLTLQCLSTSRLADFRSLLAAQTS